MESVIVISGVVLWVLLALLIILAIAFLVIGCGYIKSERERSKFKAENRTLRAELSLCQAELNVIGLKTPEFSRK